MKLMNIDWLLLPATAFLIQPVAEWNGAKGCTAFLSGRLFNDKCVQPPFPNNSSSCFLYSSSEKDSEPLFECIKTRKNSLNKTSWRVN